MRGPKFHLVWIFEEACSNSEVFKLDRRVKILFFLIRTRFWPLLSLYGISSEAIDATRGYRRILCDHNWVLVQHAEQFWPLGRWYVVGYILWQQISKFHLLTYKHHHAFFLRLLGAVKLMLCPLPCQRSIYLILSALLYQLEIIA